MIAMVVAYSNNRVIGSNNDLPWYLPADLKHFKEITSGKTVIMGRKTYDSIVARLGHSLPNRRNIVLTRDTNFKAADAEVITSLEDALKTVKNEDAYVIGGAEIFKQALPLADKIFATEIDADIDGDVYFPELDSGKWRAIDRERHAADEKNNYNFSFITYEKQV